MKITEHNYDDITASFANWLIDAIGKDVIYNPSSSEFRVTLLGQPKRKQGRLPGGAILQSQPVLHPPISELT